MVELFGWQLSFAAWREVRAVDIDLEVSEHGGLKPVSMLVLGERKRIPG